MKYNPKVYASALAWGLARAKTEKQREKYLKRFLLTLKKNSDLRLLPKIALALERRFAERGLMRRVIFESARTPTRPVRQMFKDFIQKKDAVEERLNADLIAGVKVIVNDNLEFDASLQSKLDRMFKQ